MDLIILGVGFAAQKVKDKVSDYRSPIIPFPPNALELTRSTDSQNLSIVRVPSTTTTDSNSLLTERVIIERHKEWKMRAVSLWIRQTALIDAKARNFVSLQNPVDSANSSASVRLTDFLRAQRTVAGPDL